MNKLLYQLLAIGLLAGGVCLPSKAQAQISNMCSYKPVTTPLTGTECWPINQNGVTKTVTAQEFFKNAVQGPNSSTIGDATVWSNALGTGIGDAGGPPTIKVGTNAVMSSLQIFTSLLSNGFSVLRTGYWANGDSPASVYYLSLSPCSLNAGLGDGGSQIPTTNPSGRCWLINNQPVYDVRTWGAVGDNTSTTGTISQGQTALSLASGAGYVAGQTIDIYGAGTTSTLNAPTGVTMTTEGTAGTTTYHTQIVAIDADHGYGAASAKINSDGNGNAALQVPQAGSDSQDQVISWTAPSGTAPTSYAVYDDAINATRGAGALICRAVTTQTSWRDYGQFQNSLSLANECPSWLPVNPPSSAGKDLFRPVISSVNGNAITLASAAPNACAGCIVIHDDTTPIQNALNAKTVVFLPCGNFHTTSGISLTGNNKTLRGNNKGCSLIDPDGSFEITTLGGTGTTYFSQQIENIQITGLDMAAGDCMLIQNTNRFIVDNIELSNCYNEMQVNNIFIGEVHDFFSSTRRRGDYGWWLWGNNAGGGTQTANIELRHVNSANAYQGISFHIDGNVASLRARYLGLQSAPVEMVSNNAVGATQTPTYGQFYDTGFNVCWRLCLNVTDATLMQFYSPYIQQVSAGGANNHAVVISVVDNTATPATGSVGFQIHGGTVFGGADVILDNGNGTVLDGINVFGNYDAAVECGPFSNGLLVTGVNTYNAPANIAVAAQDYGLKLDNGCANGTFIGTFVGNKANVLNSASPANEVNLSGQIDPPLTSIVTGASPALSVASFPALYQGAGQTNIIEQSGSFAPQTDTTDTATNILAGMHNPQVGTTFRFILRNHNHKSTSGGADAIVTLAGGAGVTIAGTATVPDAAQGQTTSGGAVQAGLYTWREFRGTVTNVGAPAVTIYGCSKTAAGGC